MTTTYPPEFEDEVRRWVEALIPPERLEHVRGVVQTADELAARYAPNEVLRARLAGWIHDAAKAHSDAALLDYALRHDLPITPTERLVPMLLHGAVGYALAAERFGLDDPALREACALHTTGAAGMSTLARIVFLADLIEPSRDFKGVDDLRAEAARDLDAAVLGAACQTIAYLVRRQRLIDPRAVALYNELLAAGVRTSC